MALATPARGTGRIAFASLTALLLRLAADFGSSTTASKSSSSPRGVGDAEGDQEKEEVEKEVESVFVSEIERKGFAGLWRGTAALACRTR